MACRAILEGFQSAACPLPLAGEDARACFILRWRSFGVVFWVFGLRMLVAKKSRNRIAARSPVAVTRKRAAGVLSRTRLEVNTGLVLDLFLDEADSEVFEQIKSDAAT